MLDFTVFLVLCTAIGRQASLYFFFFAPFFSFFSFFLFVGTFFFFFPTDFRLPFNLAWNTLNIWILITNINSRKMKMPSLKWTRMRFFELRLGLPVLAPPWGELLSSPDSGKSSLWTPGSPTFRLGPGRISGKKQLFDCCVQLFGGKVLQFCNFSICGWPMWPEPAPAPQRCIAIQPPLCPAYCWSFPPLHIEDHLRSICARKALPSHAFSNSRSSVKSREKSSHLKKNDSHLKNQVDCFPAHELRRGHPSKLFLVDKPVEVDVKQPEKHPSFILLALMNIATAPRKTNLNAVTATLCQYWSLSLSNALNWSPMFSCLMCRMKSFFLTWEESESSQAAELGDTKPSIWTKVWTRAGAYLSIGVGNLAELLNMLLGQLDAVGVAHQDVLFDRDRSIPRCVRFLKQLTQCWKIYESPTLPWKVSLQSMHVTTWISLKFKVAKNLEKLHLLFREI